MDGKAKGEVKAIVILQCLMGLLLVVLGCAVSSDKRAEAGKPPATNKVHLQSLRTISFEKLQARMQQPRPYPGQTNHYYNGPPGLRAYGETNLHYFVNLANDLFRFAVKPDGSPEKISIRDLDVYQIDYKWGVSDFHQGMDMHFYPTNGHRRYEMGVTRNVSRKFNDEDFSRTRFNTDPLAQEWARRCTNHLTKGIVRAMSDSVCLRLGLTKEQLAALGPPRISQQKFEDGKLSCLYTVDYFEIKNPKEKNADDVVTISLAIFGHVPGGKIVQYYQNLEQPFAKIPIPPDYKQQYDEWMNKQK